jgi:translation initiation factor IF-2
MSRRLVKVAKELNVGTTTIVEHLTRNGFEIDNRPTAAITDEMYDELMKEFHQSMEVKEQADLLMIGNRPGPKAAPEEQKAPPAKKEALPEEPPKASKEAAKEEPAVEEKEVEATTEREKPKLKVVGKIDLDKKKEAPKKEETKEKEEEKPAAKKQEEKVAEDKAPSKEKGADEDVKEADAADVDTDKPAEKPAAKAEEEMMRAKTPQLKGLKIMGKIDADKLGDPRRKKKKEAEPAKDQKEDPNKPKRKRKRKKVSTDRVAGDAGGARKKGKKSQQEEVKEVSSKEIEEKIKATMARISSGGRSKRSKVRRDSRETKREKQELQEVEDQETTIQVTEFVSVSELAGLLNIAPTDVIMACMNLGVIVSINQRLDAEIIELVASEYDKEVEFITAESEIEAEEEIVDDPAMLEPRAPIVTVMGHVDHGKTSLLDYIREANVASGEAGGITQHIGAYEVLVGDEQKKITFLDTPGHEAFTAMRARGAKVTDVAVIIIAADDHIMPQTKEAISHAQAANVPIVFAINKIDKDGADPERIKQELSAMNLLVEAWGGSYQSQDISALSGLNVDQLLEKILLEAEVLELTANPNRNAVGTVLEASLDKGRGYVTKILVTNGELSIGDSMVSGEYSGKVKAMFNDRAQRIKKAGPSTPVLVLGLNGAPQAGENFKVVDSDQEARQLAGKRAQISREQTARASKRISLDEIGRRLALGTFKELNLIVKGDVDGSVEALTDSLIKLSQTTVQVNVIHQAVGQITESDVLLASASDAIIVGFQVRPSPVARKLAENEGVQIKLYSIIYEAIEEIKMAIEGMLEPTKEETIVGQAEVRDIFKVSKVGTVAGCFVIDGKIFRNNNVRVVREGIVIYPTKEGVIGEISSLKRFKDDVKEVKSAMECGITIKNFNDIKIGDIIEAYEIKEIKQTIA